MTRLGRPLPRSFFARDTKRVARELLGCVLESTCGGTRTAGRIVETEAYVGPTDPAAHGYKNRLTPRNRSLFGRPGTAYVYRSYGIHWCFNAVTDRDGFPAAVLIRALEPLVGTRLMEQRRGVDDERILCAGPGRLTQALGITDAVDGASLGVRPVRLLRGDGRRVNVVVTGRIGVTKAADWPLRFVMAGTRWASR